MSVTEWCQFKYAGGYTGAAMAGVTVTGKAVNCQAWRDGQTELIAFPQRGTVARTCTVTWQSSPPPRTSEGTYGYDNVDDGHLHMATGANTKMAISSAFLTTGISQLHQVSFWLSRLGTPALAGGGTPRMRATINANAGADPDAQIGVFEGDINCADIPLGPQPTKMTCIFDAPIDIAAATTYHVVLTAVYDVSAANNIAIHFNTVAGGAQRCRELDIAWGAAALRNFWMELLELNFAAEAANILPTVAHTVIQPEGVNQTGVFHERRNFNVNALVNGPYIRPVFTYGAGAFAWLPVLTGVTLADPINIPVAETLI
jgi:hypothetical protein